MQMVTRPRPMLRLSQGNPVKLICSGSSRIRSAWWTFLLTLLLYCFRTICCHLTPERTDVTILSFVYNGPKLITCDRNRNTCCNRWWANWTSCRWRRWEWNDLPRWAAWGQWRCAPRTWEWDYISWRSRCRWQSIWSYWIWILESKKVNRVD